MHSHKTVLVSCNIINSPQAMPLATAILKSYQPYKTEVEIILENFHLNDTPFKAAETILKDNPDSIGFSIYIWNRDFLVQTAELIKAENKNIIIFAGGAEITASAPSLMDNNNFDYLIRGEGEIPFVKLLEFLTGKKKIKPGKLLNMSYLNDLELIPSPYLSSNLNPAEWDGLLWELSRGCPYNCSFCSESRGVKGVRYYNEERIQKELILFEGEKTEQIFVLDPTFNIDRDRALGIIGLIKEYAPDIHFTFEIRAELLDEELASEFAEIHCSLQIGLQSSQPDVLKNVNRNFDPDKFTEKISLLNKYGAVFGLDLIYGLPGDTIGGFLESLDYALYQIPNHLDIFRLSVFPGTELYERAGHFNLLCEKEVPYSIISGPGYSKTELDKSEEIARAVDIFYNIGKSAGWLLSISDVLDISPSMFFIRLTEFIKNNNPDLENNYKLQYHFLESIFKLQNKIEYLSTALDLCKFHYLYSEALYAESNPLNNDTIVTSYLEQNFVRSSILKTGIFNFDVTLYAEQGMIDIADFVQNNLCDESYALLFNNGYAIETLPVEKYIYDIVEKITGEHTLSEILQQLDIKPANAEEFISFLLESNLIVPENSGA